MRYEDFLDDPDTWMKKLGGFLGQEDLGTCLEGFRVKKGNTEKWRNGFFFSKSERQIFLKVAGIALVDAGYEESFPMPKVPVWQLLLWRIDDMWRRFSNRLLRRHGRRPIV